MRLSLKLAVLCAALILLPFVIALVVAPYRVASQAHDRLTAQLQADAKTAVSLYEKRLAELRVAAQRLAVDIANKSVISADSTEAEKNTAKAQAQDLLSAAQNELSLDFLLIADLSGRVLVRHNDRPADSETLLDSGQKSLIAEKVFAEAKQGKSVPAASYVIEGGEHLVQWNLAQRARVESNGQAVVEEALMLEAGAPIFTAGRCFGLVLVGQLLNNSFVARAGARGLQLPLEEEMRDTLYGNRESGVAIALGDTIVAANLGGAAMVNKPSLIGLRIDASQPLLTRDERSYAIAWQTLTALNDNQPVRVGVMLPASESSGAANQVSTILILIAGLAFLLALALGFLFGQGLGKRLTTLGEATSRMAVGELSRPVEDLPSPVESILPQSIARDEVTELAERLDQMRESFRQAIDRLRKRKGAAADAQMRAEDEG